MNDNIERSIEEMQDYLNAVSAAMFLKQCNERDKVLVTAFNQNGIDSCDIPFIINQVQCINREGDRFEHYYLDYGKETEKRILSIEKTPSVNYYDGKVTIEEKYY